MTATAEARNWLGLAAAARQLHISKISDEATAIAVTTAAHTGIDGNNNGSSIGRWRELLVNIAATRRRQDDINGGSDEVGASLDWIGGSGSE